MNETQMIAPEGWELTRIPGSTELLANNIGAAATHMSVAVGYRQDGGELTMGATANLKIIRRWADILLAGEIPQPGDGVSDG